jgi:hypothetical protein
MKNPKGDMKHVYTEGPQILGTIVQSLVASQAWRLGFVNSWISKGKGKVHPKTGQEGPEWE